MRLRGDSDRGGSALAGQTVDRASAWIARHPLAAIGHAPGRRVAPITRCRTCSAHVRKKDFTLRCRSCGGVLAEDSDLVERARPDGLVPFAIDEEAAQAAFAAWTAARRLLPRSLARGEPRLTALDGVFLPLWSFSTNTVSDYVGKIDRTRTLSVSGHPQRRTAWQRVTGRTGRYFDAVMLPACSLVAPQTLFWPLDQLVPYVRGGSRGRRILAYDVEPEQGFEQAKALMRWQIRQDALNTINLNTINLNGFGLNAIGGSHQQVTSVTTRYDDPAYSLLLLPAWLATYEHGGRTWSVVVNGVTGRVAGRRPYSPAKISALTVLLASIAVAEQVLMHH